MDILVFSANKNTKDAFKIRRKGVHFSLPEFFPLSEIGQRLTEINPGSLVYLDLTGVGETDVRRHVRSLSKKSDIYFGVLDPGGKVSDVAGLFHEGAVDYVDKRVFQKGVMAARLNRIHGFIETFRRQIQKKAAAPQPKLTTADYIPSGDSWKNVVSGKEYTFFMLFIELDGKEEMEKRYERENLDAALTSFRKYVEVSFAPYGGLIFIWFRFGGLLLFPFGSRKSASLLGGFRFVIYKHLYDIEGSRFPHFLSIRMALHIGNTLYSRTNTGHIVSDSLNTVFHLGQQYTKPGIFTLTEDVYEFIDSRLKPYFLEVGSFERRRIYRMRTLDYKG